MEYSTPLYAAVSDSSASTYGSSAITQLPLLSDIGALDADRQRLERILQYVCASPDSRTLVQNSVNHTLLSALCSSPPLLVQLFDQATGRGGGGGVNGSEDVAVVFPDLLLERYRPRFVAYSLLSAVAVAFNALSVLALLKICAHWSGHHLLLLNLAVGDLLGTMLLWVHHNAPILFPYFRLHTLPHCLFITLVLVAPFIMALCNSLCSLLMLALNQYMAICQPILSTTRITKTRIRTAIGLSWTASLTLASVPLLVMLYRQRYDQCARYVVNMGVRSMQLCAYTLLGVVTITIVLYAQIYHVIRTYRRQSAISTASGSLRRNQARVSNHNYKAFLTTLLLAGTLIVFWIPYIIFHFLSAHVDVAMLPDAVLDVKFYVIDLLPVLHFLTDPAIYGVRMKEIRLGYRRLAASIVACCCCCWHRQRLKPCAATVRLSVNDVESTAV